VTKIELTFFHDDFVFQLLDYDPSVEWLQQHLFVVVTQIQSIIFHDIYIFLFCCSIVGLQLGCGLVVIEII
jgi:hypothetical protein